MTLTKDINKKNLKKCPFVSSTVSKSVLLPSIFFWSTMDSHSGENVSSMACQSDGAICFSLCGRGGEQTKQKGLNVSRRQFLSEQGHAFYARFVPHRPSGQKSRREKNSDWRVGEGAITTSLPPFLSSRLRHSCPAGCL